MLIEHCVMLMFAVDIPPVNTCIQHISKSSSFRIVNWFHSHIRPNLCVLQVSTTVVFEGVCTVKMHHSSCPPFGFQGQTCFVAVDKFCIVERRYFQQGWICKLFVLLLHIQYSENFHTANRELQPPLNFDHLFSFLVYRYVYLICTYNNQEMRLYEMEYIHTSSICTQQCLVYIHIHIHVYIYMFLADVSWA